MVSHVCHGRNSEAASAVTKAVFYRCFDRHHPLWWGFVELAERLVECSAGGTVKGREGVFFSSQREGSRQERMDVTAGSLVTRLLSFYTRSCHVSLLPLSAQVAT